MNVTLFGATGKLGRRVLEQATARGHRVRVLVRSPSGLGTPPAEVRVIVGDARDPDALAESVSGQDAVVNCIGGEGEIRIEALSRIIPSMDRAGVRRIVNLGGAGLLDLWGRMLHRRRFFPRAMRPVTLQHLQVLRALEASGLDWTLVCPPFMSTEGGGNGYRARADRAFLTAPRVGLGEVAELILDELERPRFLRKRVAVRGR